MRIFHIATVADWDAALASGRYTTSTRGRTLAEEGFVHASRGDQWQAVRARYYADVAEPLVLLVIDPDLLGSPVVEEQVPGTDETFPHVYGPIEPAAVVRTIPLTGPGAPDDPTVPVVTALASDEAVAHPRPASPSFSRLFLQELFRNLLVASAVLVLVVLGSVAGAAVDDRWGPLTGAAVGLVVGLAAARLVGRRLDVRNSPPG